MPAEDAKRLCSFITDQVVFDNCVFDLTVTGNAAMADGYRNTLQVRATP
jgi:ketosteroid isomerase-like protein